MFRYLTVGLLLSIPVSAFAQGVSCEDNLAAFKQYAQDLKTSRDTNEGLVSELRVSLKKVGDELQLLKSKEVKTNDVKKSE